MTPRCRCAQPRDAPPQALRNSLPTCSYNAARLRRFSGYNGRPLTPLSNESNNETLCRGRAGDPVAVGRRLNAPRRTRRFLEPDEFRSLVDAGGGSGQVEARVRLIES